MMAASLSVEEKIQKVKLYYACDENYAKVQSKLFQDGVKSGNLIQNTGLRIKEITSQASPILVMLFQCLTKQVVLNALY